MLASIRLLFGLLLLTGLVGFAIVPQENAPPSAVSEGQVPIQTPASLLAAQAAPSPTPEPSPAPTLTITPRPQVIVWWPAALYPPADSPALDALINQFDDYRAVNNTSLQVRIKRLTGTGSIMSTLRTAQGIAPAAIADLVLMRREELIVAAETGLIYPLTSILPDALKDNLYGHAAELGQIGEQIYGIPYALTIQQTAYRTNAFETVPDTLDAVLEAGRRFIFCGIHDEIMEDLFLIQYVAAGGRTLDSDGRPVLDEGPLLDILTFYETALANGIASADVLANASAVDYWPAFLSGAFSLAQVDSSTFLALERPHDDIAAGPIPTLNGNALTTLDGWLWALTTSEPERQARALDFLTWIMRAENQAAFTEAMHILPSQRAALALSGDSNYLRLVDSLLNGPAVILPENINPTVADELQQALAAVLNGEQTAAEAAAQAALSIQ